MSETRDLKDLPDVVSGDSVGIVDVSLEEDDLSSEVEAHLSAVQTSEATASDSDDDVEQPSEKVEVPESLDVVETGEAVDEPQDLTALVEEQAKRVEAGEREVAVRIQRVATNKSRVDKVRHDLAVLSTTRDSLGTWLHEREDSLALRLLDHLDGQDRQLSADEERISAWAKHPIPETQMRARVLRSIFVRAMWTSFIFSILIPEILYWIARWMQSNQGEMPFFGTEGWKYWVLGIALFILFTLLSLFSYHRGYIAMSQEVTRHLARGRYLLNSIQVLRVERARLGGLIPQLKERLEFLGAVLQEPWRVPGFAGEERDTTELAKSLPALLQLGTAQQGQNEILRGLRDYVTAQEIFVGARREAVDELLQVAARRKGLSPENADLAAIDRDISSYGLRSALYELVRDASVLEELGRIKVAELAQKMQGELDHKPELGVDSSSNNRPSIALVNNDYLDGLRVTHDLLAEWRDSNVGWDEFVSEILENGSALSKLAFSSSGLIADRHVEFDTLAVAPQRTHALAGELVKFSELDSGSVRNTEIVARLDITKPMNVEDVALFSSVVQESYWQMSDTSAGSRSLNEAVANDYGNDHEDTI